MFQSVKKLTGLKIRALDGDIGAVDQFFFDDRSWAVRYLVVTIGSIINPKKVLLSPASLDTIESHELIVKSTVDQIKSSPDIDTEKPISRQKEEELHDYYTWSYYWGYPLYYNSMGTELYPNIQFNESFLNKTSHQETRHVSEDESHLRSTREIIGYRVSTNNGELGYVDDILLEIDHWGLRYLVINTGEFLPGKKILVGAYWTTNISWEDRTLSLDVNIDILRNGPTYDSSIPLSRDFERRVYEYYERTPYWIEERK